MKKASKLRRAREKAKLQGYEVAEKLGIPLNHYAAIEIHCWEDPTPEETRKICTFFGMSAQELDLPELAERSV